jgi:hypothetical protein
MSFSLTTCQMLAGTKSVTRRMGWHCLKAGDRVMACEKVMGRRKGEPLVRLFPIKILSVRRERLDSIQMDQTYGALEVRREGFPEMTPWGFVRFFIKSHKGCEEFTMVTRIEFRREIP